MRRFTNLSKFLDCDVRECVYIYKPTFFKSERLLLANNHYREFSFSLVNRIKKIHDKITEELMVKQIPNTEWGRMKNRLVKISKTIKPKEKLSIKVLYELNDNYELTVEIQTFIR